MIRRHLNKIKAVAAKPVAYSLKMMPNTRMGSWIVIGKSAYFLPNKTARREQSWKEKKRTLYTLRVDVSSMCKRSSKFTKGITIGKLYRIIKQNLFKKVHAFKNHGHKIYIFKNNINNTVKEK